jgi:hypothetical protein
MLLDIHHNPVSRCRDLAKDYEEYVHAAGFYELGKKWFFLLMEYNKPESSAGDC